MYYSVIGFGIKCVMYMYYRTVRWVGLQGY